MIDDHQEATSLAAIDPPTDRGLIVVSSREESVRVRACLKTGCC